MRVELITIGDELLLGFTIDTNAAHIARELAPAGVQVVGRATVGDDAVAIADAVRAALDRTGAVITTGGLGPTSDDLTHPSIAALFGRPLRLHEEIIEALERRFRALGYTRGMPPANRQQALIPEGARILHNRHGTAPGIWLEDERRRWVATLPGVPREMRGMLADELLPLLRERAGESPTVVASRTLRTAGIGESALAELLGGDAHGTPGLPLAYSAGWEGVDLRLTARELPPAEATRLLDEGAAKLYARIGRYVYGEGTADLAEVVLKQCREAGLTLATAESCTGGMLGARVTAVPGSSIVYLGGVIAYANDIKIDVLGVRPEALHEYGAVSEPVAEQLAAGVCARLDSDIGIGITGVAGPGGGTPGKPVGTVWIAMQLSGVLTTLGRVYVGDREEIRRRSCQAALELIRRALAAPA